MDDNKQIEVKMRLENDLRREKIFSLQEKERPSKTTWIRTISSIMITSHHPDVDVDEQTRSVHPFRLIITDCLNDSMVK